MSEYSLLTAVSEHGGDYTQRKPGSPCPKDILKGHEYIIDTAAPTNRLVAVVGRIGASSTD